MKYQIYNFSISCTILIIASLTGCCCSVRTAPTGATKRYLRQRNNIADEIPVNRLDIARINTNDMYLARLYAHFVRYVDEKYKGHIVKNYDPKTHGPVDRYVAPA